MNKSIFNTKFYNFIINNICKFNTFFKNNIISYNFNFTIFYDIIIKIIKINGDIFNSMIKKRIKQFYINLTDTMLEEDYKYVQNILTKEEYSLFLKLQVSEQAHSIRVAKSIAKELDSNYSREQDFIEKKDSLIKLSLLHDIGKINKKVNIIDKSIIVILNKITKGKLIKLKNDKIQCYYKHPEYSYNLLKNIYNDKFALNIIKNHHSLTDDKFILLFQKIDDEN